MKRVYKHKALAQNILKESRLHKDSYKYNLIGTIWIVWSTLILLCTKSCLAPPIRIFMNELYTKALLSFWNRINPKIVKLKLHLRLAFNNQYRGHLIKKKNKNIQGPISHWEAFPLSIVRRIIKNIKTKIIIKKKTENRKQKTKKRHKYCFLNA